MRPIYICIIFLCALAASAQAQRKDSLQLYQQFLMVCNHYKQLPLQITASIAAKTNLITSREDTASAEAVFFLNTSGTYLRIGETEQLVVDSLALYISNDAKRILVYRNSASVSDQLERYLGMQNGKSSLQSIKKLFSINADDTLGMGQISLRSRKLLFGTELPKEELKLIYHPQSSEPVWVKSLGRRLIALSKEEYETLAAKPDLKDHLLADKQNYYLIKEQVTEYRFTKIAHDNVLLPVQIQDRVERDAAGIYQPSKSMASYTVTQY